jgi:hypothetical protein
VTLKELEVGGQKFEMLTHVGKLQNSIWNRKKVRVKNKTKRGWGMEAPGRIWEEDTKLVY